MDVRRDTTKLIKLITIERVHDKLEQVGIKSKSGEYVIIQEEGMMGKRGEG